MHEITHVRIHDKARSLDLDVTVASTTTLAELLTAINAVEHAERASSVVWIDGAARNPATPVGEAGLRNGSTLSLARPPVVDEAPAVASLEQLAGASGADATPLPVGRFDFSPADDTPTTEFVWPRLHRFTTKRWTTSKSSRELPARKQSFLWCRRIRWTVSALVRLAR